MQHRWDKSPPCKGSTEQRPLRDLMSQKMDRGRVSTTEHGVRLEKSALGPPEKEASELKKCGLEMQTCLGA